MIAVTARATVPSAVSSWVFFRNPSNHCCTCSTFSGRKFFSMKACRSVWIVLKTGKADMIAKPIASRGTTASSMV